MPNARSAETVKVGTTVATILPLLRDVLKARLYVEGRIAKAIFEDSLKSGVLDPIAKIAVQYVDSKPVAWCVRTSDDWRTGFDGDMPKTENEMFWRFTVPSLRHQGRYQELKKIVSR